ncbi:MAG: hypothetical protein DIZ80_00150 [endosymbiont of Galathealinum brachiosum]|uniref:Uncharacterized protein n=1 Tax=endosymbiont of Galathealinum brachiosum TaxID=2200906 RepID=A0A370DM50_9GAMM|nr:MAG: hypothetical protein DIZ80_00150 [endosymbiont of Galathealinum brachiosum]
MRSVIICKSLMNIEIIKQLIYRHPGIYSISIALILISAFQIDFTEEKIRDDKGRTPLYLAAENSDVSTVASLLEEIDNPDQRDSCEWTPLMRSAQNKHGEVAKLLLDAGANVNAKDKGGYSVLMVASGSDNAGIIKLLADKGANINEQEKDLGWSALIWSAKEGLYDNVVALLEAGADVSLKDATGKTAYDWAIEKGYDEIARKLTE